MLQDVELGRSMELESIIGAVIELGKMVDIGTPYTSFIYGLIKLRNDSLAESKMA
jgi:2-dehydropantoate 2-reductase